MALDVFRFILEEIIGTLTYYNIETIHCLPACARSGTFNTVPPITDINGPASKTSETVYLTWCNIQEDLNLDQLEHLL
jgi:hypothetical protein